MSDLGLGTGKALKSVGENDSRREGHYEEAFFIIYHISEGIFI
jgi:hypothetical protein